MVLFTTVKTISFLMSLRDFTGIKIQVSGFAVNKFEFFAIIYDFSRGFYKQIQRLFEPKTLIKVHSITVKNSSSSLTAICFSFE